MAPRQEWVMLNFYYLWHQKNGRIAVFGLILLYFTPMMVWAQPQDSWTLSMSIQRALKVAPEMKTADAEIGKQQGKLEQADVWPNPSVTIQVDDSLGLEDATGGYDVTQFAISQPLPLGRLTHQREQAEAGLASAEAQRHQQQLALEYMVAQRFHVLQLAKAKLQLAKKRLQQARRYQNIGRKRHSGDPLVRYLTPLETMRLDIVLQAAKQTMEVAEGEFNEVTASFKALLNLPIDKALSLNPLTPVPTPEAFNILENSLQQHPTLEADKQMIASSRAGVAVARSQRFADPTLTLFRAEEFIGNRRQDSTGIMLNMQIPLWNKNNGRVSQARYVVHQAQADLVLNQRELRTRLHKSYLHLGHLIEQAEHYRSKLLKPAQRVFTLTRNGFEAGELNILTLIDANNTWFDAQARYLELLQEGWLELAEVRRSAGLSLLTNNSMSNIGTYSGGVN
jgi:cobalt-zinc-cadmium efflux system outer membrane protein